VDAVDQYRDWIKKVTDKQILIRAKHTNGSTKVRVLISHPMIGHSTLDAEDDNDNKPHFIQDITCHLGEETIMSALCSSYVGKDPFIGFEFKGGSKGETIRVTWVDNRGERGSSEASID
jgi:sulfur-oxidizing protein SoxZ